MPSTGTGSGPDDASPATLRRLMKEYQTEQQQASTSAQGNAARRDDNILHLSPRRDADGEPQLLSWQATLRGPASGAYDGGLFDVSISVPGTYPTKPPSMRFTTRIWHPNVSWKTGEICLDVLSSQWSPAWTLSSACTAVVALLDAPEPDSPLNVDAATVLRTGDTIAYRSMCRMHTALWASAAPA